MIEWISGILSNDFFQVIALTCIVFTVGWLFLLREDKKDDDSSDNKSDE